MKQSLFLLSVLIICGCAAPLEKESVSTQVAGDAAVVESDIHDKLRVSFTVTSFGILKGVWNSNGVIMLTDTELLVYVQYEEDGADELDLRVPYSSMRGINCQKYGRAYQIQIVGDVGILAIEVTHGGVLIDKKASQKLCDHIKTKGVPQVTAEGRIFIELGPVILGPSF